MQTDITTTKDNDVMTVLREMGIDPVRELVKLLNGGELSPPIRAKTLLELTNYIHPKKKSIEHTAKGGGLSNIQFVVNLDGNTET